MQPDAPSVRDIVATPLADLNLDGEELPDALRDAMVAPFAAEKLTDCAAIGEEIARLTTALGPDLDLTSRRTALMPGKVAQQVVGSFIPFRSVVREVSGAAGRQREMERALQAGAVRRGFLKGIGQERGCPYPARPASKAERELWLKQVAAARGEEIEER